MFVNFSMADVDVCGCVVDLFVDVCGFVHGCCGFVVDVLWIVCGCLWICCGFVWLFVDFM